METTKKTLKISIATQKGGVGKSTMTILLASVLHYRLGYNALVMDCDFPQHSLTHLRERDNENHNAERIPQANGNETVSSH